MKVKLEQENLAFKRQKFELEREERFRYREGRRI